MTRARAFPFFAAIKCALALRTLGLMSLALLLLLSAPAAAQNSAAQSAMLNALQGDLTANLTLSLDTSAYASGDVVADTQEISGVFRNSTGRRLLRNIVLIDEDDQKVALFLLFFRSNVSLGTENSAPSISDANAREIVCHVPIVAGDYVDVGGASVAVVKNIACMLEGSTASTSLYVAVLNATGTPTYTAAGLKLALGLGGS